jgi:hypothetical protein
MKNPIMRVNKSDDGIYIYEVYETSLSQLAATYYSMPDERFSDFLNRIAKDIELLIETNN